MKAILMSIVKPRAWIAKVLLIITLAALIWFVQQEEFAAVKAFLDGDRLSYQLGETRVSVFMVLKGITLIVAGLWIASWASESLEKRIKKLERIRSSNKVILVKVAQVVIYLVFALVILDILGIDLMTLGILGGAIGIGIGFGLQKITSNFIAGLILLFEKSIEIEDFVELPDGLCGFIRHTGARYSLLETVDGKEVLVPNEDFVTSRVTNWTYSNTEARITIAIGVAYGSDLDLVKRIILDVIDQHPDCSKDTEPQCFLDEFADSSINFTAFFWVDDITKGWRAQKSDILQGIWRQFNEHGIEIPFPQRDVHMQSKGG